jgi:plasmid replication initiation protein
LGDRYISVEDLKKWLQLEDKYDRYNNLNQRVLTPALSEINEKSDLFVEYEPIKKGRKVTGIEFSITYEKTVKKRPKFPHKNKYGKYVTLNRDDPRMSNHEYGVWAKDCLKILEDFYQKIEDVPNEDLLFYWIFLAGNASNKSKLGTKKTFVDELKKRGYKIVKCELVKL